MNKADVYSKATKAEAAILDYLALHPTATNEQIGLALGRSVLTVDKQLVNLYKRLSLPTNRAVLVSALTEPQS